MPAKVLVVGGGGREHALAATLARSPQVGAVLVAPGNAGTAAEAKCNNIALDPCDISGIVDFAKREAVSLVVVGPEQPLELGLADALQEAGIRVFGPSTEAAKLETSKAHCKALLQNNNIRTPRAEIFSDPDKALAHLAELDEVPVVKVSGLAAGKGVIVANTKAEAATAIKSALIDGAFGQSGEEVLLEKRLFGEEMSAMAFCDGTNFQMMPIAKDYKRLLDGDLGPNTGGMGAVCPSPLADEVKAELIAQKVFAPTLEALAASGVRYVGVLYAGIMWGEQGPAVIEFNCRFGDPEAQVVLPLLNSDLYELIVACCEERLADFEIEWRDLACVAVVMASAGYPSRGGDSVPIFGVGDLALGGTQIFHAGTQVQGGQLHTAGGRVLAVSSLGQTTSEAAASAYQGIELISFEGKQHRRDIAKIGSQEDKYRMAGVDIDAAQRTVEAISNAVHATKTDHVLSDVGAFGGLFAADALGPNKVLVASTDGVGTKALLAAQHGRHFGLGIDLVNHCVNDILVQGAKPLFFLDYIGCGKLQPEIVVEIVEGMSQACLAANCALLGGEIAEMPGTYVPGGIDIVGTIVGVVERESLLPQTESYCPGDLLVGLPSCGPHTNGYSLIRKILNERLAMAGDGGQAGDGRVADDEGHADDGEQAGEERQSSRGEFQAIVDFCLQPHRSYLADFESLTSQGLRPKAIAHITGGGVIENLPRVLPENLGAEIDLGAWPVPTEFSLLVDWGGISQAEAFRVWNMGIGMIVVVDHSQGGLIQSSGLPVVGKLTRKNTPKSVIFHGSWR